MVMFKNRKAQQLVEFLLVAPFIVIFLGVLTEYAYALNCNLTLSQGLKQVTSTIYREIVPNISDSNIRNYVISELTNYLQTNNVPVGGAYSLDVGYYPGASTTKNAVFIASYDYTPAFTLPNVFFHIMPEKFTFRATSSVPAAFLSSNAYDSTISSTKLDGIWNSTANFSSLNAFDTSKRGIMNLTPSATPNIMFLVPQTVAVAGNYYALLYWSGNKIEPRYLNLADGILYTCDATTCTSSGTKLLSTYSGVYNFVFIPKEDTDLTYAGTDATKLKSYWIHVKDSCNTTAPKPCVDTTNPISDKTVDGILKRNLAIIGVTGLSIGNYDGLDVSAASYNPSVVENNSYIVETYGSIVFAHPISVDVSVIINQLKLTNPNPVNATRNTDSSEFGT